MSDPVVDMILEAEEQEAAEREERSMLLQRLTELQASIAELKKAVDILIGMERAERAQYRNTNSGGTVYTVTERDDNGQIKTFKVIH